MDRRVFIKAAGALSAAAAAGERAVGAERGFDPTEQTIAALMRALGSGAITSAALTAAYLGRIARFDHQGLEHRSVLALNPEALAAARVLDVERRANRLRDALHGIPLIIKDNIETKDPMPTTAGSLAFARSTHSFDAPLVARLRASGAIVLGKGNLSEWANFRSTRSSSGWSAVGGQTRNAYARDRNPSGSSAGSGVAALIAAAMAERPLGFGAHGNDLEAFRLRGFRIGAMPVPPRAHPDTAQLVADARSALEREGAVITDLKNPAAFEESEAPEFEALLYEFKEAINAYLATLDPAKVDCRTLADLIDFNRINGDAELVVFGQEIFAMAEARGPLTDPTYQKAIATLQRAADGDGLATLLGQQRVEILIAPSNGPPAR